MAKYVLQNTITLDNLTIRPGKVLDDTVMDVARYRLAGAQLASYDDETARNNATALQNSAAKGQQTNTDPSQRVWMPSLSTTKRARDLDVNSLVLGDVSTGLWRRMSDYPKVYPARLGASAPRPAWLQPGTPNTWIRCNPAKDANSFGRILYQLQQPADWAGIGMDVTAIGSVMGETIRLAIWDASNMNYVTSKFVQLTTDAGLYTLEASLPPTGVYLFGFETQVAGFTRASPDIGRVRIRPIGGKGIWGDDFVRVDINATNLSGNVFKDYVVGTWLRQCSHCHIDLTTDAPDVGVETWSQGPGSNFNNICCFVDDEFYANGQSILDNNHMFDTFNLPRPGSRQRVSIYNGYGSNWLPLTSSYNAFPRSVFVRAGNQFEVTSYDQ